MGWRAGVVGGAAGLVVGAGEDAVAREIEQAGAIVTEGYVGLIDNSATPPITTDFRRGCAHREVDG